MVQFTSVSPPGHEDLPDCQLEIQWLFLQACKPQTYSAQDNRVHDKKSLQRNEGLRQISRSFFSRAADKGGIKAFEGVSASKRKRGNFVSTLPSPAQSAARLGRRGAGGAPSQLGSQGWELFGLDEEFQVETIWMYVCACVKLNCV